MAFVWDLLYFVLLLLGAPVILYRVIARRKYRSGFLEQLGSAPRRRGERECLWVHGVSVGEVLASRTLVRAFRERHPDWDVVVSTTTDTGYAAAAANFPDDTVIRYPFDFSFAVSRSLSRIRPSIVVLMELELWPNFTRACRRRRIPVIIANGRLGEKSYRRQKTFRFVLAPSYGRIALIAAQTETYARRFRDVGVPPGRIRVTGSLKYDAVPRDVPDAGAFRRELEIAEDEKVIVAGSTFAGEDEILIDVYAVLKAEFPKLRLVLVPRHPERFDAVASLIRAKGFDAFRRSTGEGTSADAVILGDTMGELTGFYAAANVVFVGKSLVAPGGGQNVIEPAALGKPVVFGPHTENFRETCELLIADEAAMEVTDADSLVSALRQLLSDERVSSEMGQRARRIVASQRGAAGRTVELIEEVLASTADLV